MVSREMEKSTFNIISDNEMLHLVKRGVCIAGQFRVKIVINYGIFLT